MTGPTDGLDKAAWRRHVLAARAALPAAAHRAATAAFARHLQAVTGIVCAYLPVGSEPGVSPDLLVEVGATVLLPVVPETGPLDWARYEPGGTLMPGALRIPEPIGPRLGPDAIAEAGLVLVPALAVDVRGVRLGRGAGWYDRTLPLAAPGSTVAVVRDEEFVPALPADPHDVPVSAVLTPSRGVFPVPT